MTQNRLRNVSGTRTLRYLWYEQRGLCTQCNTKIARITGWRLHYCVLRVMGGSTGATNCVLLHPECHDRVHRQRLPVSNQSPHTGRSKGLSWVKGNFHAQFSERAAARPSGYSVIKWVIKSFLSLARSGWGERQGASSNAEPRTCRELRRMQGRSRATKRGRRCLQ